MVHGLHYRLNFPKLKTFTYHCLLVYGKSTQMPGASVGLTGTSVKLLSELYFMDFQFKTSNVLKLTFIELTSTFIEFSNSFSKF